MERGYRSGQRVLFLMLVVLSPCAFSKTVASPINIQAALIKNFTHLIEWPNKHRWESSETFNICIYNSNALEQQFKDIFVGKMIKGKKANVVTIRSSDLGGCDLAYIAASTRESLAQLMKSSSEQGVLTVSANSGYGALGIHINFFESSEHVAFELNKHSLDSAGFQVSTQLYRYARIVQ